MLTRSYKRIYIKITLHPREILKFPRMQKTAHSMCGFTEYASGFIKTYPIQTVIKTIFLTCICRWVITCTLYMSTGSPKGKGGVYAMYRVKIPNKKCW